MLLVFKKEIYLNLLHCGINNTHCFILKWFYFNTLGTEKLKLDLQTHKQIITLSRDPNIYNSWVDFCVCFQKQK